MIFVSLNPSYTGFRSDILGLIPDNVSKVLDIGCSTGALGEKIKQRSRAKVVGIERDKQMAEIAKKKLDRVIIGNVEKINLVNCLKPNYFDCIIFGDVLEHLKYPWSVLKKSVKFLTDKGVVVSSIPNIRHYTTIFNLTFKGNWPYRERGIHDKTHLRFFTLKNIKEMFQGAGLEVIEVKRNYRIIERSQRLSKLTELFTFFPFRDFITFQYLFLAKKQR